MKTDFLQSRERSPSMRWIIEGLLILFLEELFYRLTEDYMFFDIDKIIYQY